MKYKYNGIVYDVSIKALDSMPIGTIILFAGEDNKIPTGWLECDGRVVAREGLEELYDVIGAIYGTPPSNSEFYLPDLRGKVPVGMKSTDTDFDTLGETGGSKTDDLSNAYAKVGRSSSDYNVLQYTQKNGSGSFNRKFTANSNVIGGSDNSITDATELGGSVSTLQPYLVVKYIIKAYNTTPTMASIVNSYSTSTQDGYSCDYINDMSDYSTLEVNTHRKWVDGKDIYRKVYSSRITTQTSNIDINHFLANVDTIISITGGTKGNNYSYPFYWKDNTDHFLAILSQATTNLNIQIGTSYPSVPFNATVIVEYTKTS